MRGGPLGRPPRPAAERRAAFRIVARTWKRLGPRTGWRTIRAALGDRVPVRLIQETLRVVKEQHRRHKARRRARHRVHVEALLASDADCVCYTATADLRPFEAIEDIATILARGKNVVSSSVVPLVHPTSFGSPEVVEKLQDACRRGGTS